MAEVQAIDADLPNNKAILKFRNNDRPCVVMTAEKAASDAKMFRVAASLLSPLQNDQAQTLSAWFLKLATNYEMGDLG